MKDTRIQKLSFETSLNRNIAEKNKKIEIDPFIENIEWS